MGKRECPACMARLDRDVGEVHEPIGPQGFESPDGSLQCAGRILTSWTSSKKVRAVTCAATDSTRPSISRRATARQR